MSYTNLRNALARKASTVWTCHQSTAGYMNFYTHEFPDCPAILFDVTSRQGGKSLQISLVLTNTAFVQNRDRILELFQQHGIAVKLEKRYGTEGGLGRILYQDGKRFTNEIDNVEDMDNELEKFHDQIPEDVFTGLRNYIQ